MITNISLNQQQISSREINHSQNTTTSINKEENVTEITNEHFFQFPEKSTIMLSTKKIVDISNIDLDLSGIFRGGIGSGASASKLLTRTMKTIGHGEYVYNLPFCIEGFLSLPKEFCELKVFSTENKAVPASTIRDFIKELIEKGFTTVNIIINLDQHTSLVSIVILNNTATLRFYDSLSPEIISYDERYNEELIDFIKSLLPSSISLTNDKADVLHLLDQGGKNSTGCGYYALYTAMLLKDNESIRTTASFCEKPLLDETDDKKIRADLIVRTLLDYGLEKVDTDVLVLSMKRRNHVFDFMGFSVRCLIEKLKPRMEDK